MIIHFSLSISYIYHPCQSMIWIQQTINRFSPNKMKLISVKRCKKFLDRYFNKIHDEKEIIFWAATGDDHNTQLKFALTHSIICFTLKLFHAMLEHPGSHCIHAMLQTLNTLSAWNLNTTNLLDLGAGYSWIRTMLVLFGRKMQLIFFAHS